MSLANCYRVDGPSSRLQIWTYKAGLMARLAHDLLIEAGGYRFERDGSVLRLRVPGNELRVVGAVRGRDLQSAVLTEGDRREIEGTLREKVLEVGRYPEICFEMPMAVLEGGVLEGRLVIRGQAQTLRLAGRMEREGRGLRLVGDVRLRQSDFGIKPYQAMFGALKIKDELDVNWDIRLIEENSGLEPEKN